MLDTLLTRENDNWPAGSLPRAFSDMPRNCIGTASSIEEIDAVLDCWPDGEECDGVGCMVCSSSESSSSPTVKAPPSSGTLLREGDRVLPGLRRLSIELVCARRKGLKVLDPSAASFRIWLSLSISSWPVSSVKERRASNLFLDFNMP